MRGFIQFTYLDDVKDSKPIKRKGIVAIDKIEMIGETNKGKACIHTTGSFQTTLESYDFIMETLKNALIKEEEERVARTVKMTWDVPTKWLKYHPDKKGKDGMIPFGSINYIEEAKEHTIIHLKDGSKKELKTQFSEVQRIMDCK